MFTLSNMGFMHVTRVSTRPAVVNRFGHLERCFPRIIPSQIARIMGNAHSNGQDLQSMADSSTTYLASTTNGRSSLAPLTAKSLRHKESSSSLNSGPRVYQHSNKSDKSIGSDASKTSI